MTASRSATLVATLLLVGFARSAAADARTTTVQEDGADVQVTRLEVTPADEPVPTFRYRLRHRPLELVEGNAPQWYMRALPEETASWRKWNELTDDESFEPYYTSGTPVSTLSRKRLAESDIFNYIVENCVVEGARRRSCDWGIRSFDQRGPEAVEFLLPEFQTTRNIARMTMRNVRHAVAEGRHDDAIRFLNASYRLGHDVATEPLLVCGLIGIAIAEYANSGVADVIASPGSPNLYWALTELPSPPVSLEEALRVQADGLLRVVPEFADVDTATRSPAEWDGMWRRGTTSKENYELLRQSVPDLPPLAELSASAVAPETVAHARARLKALGMSKTKVDAMPLGQVMMVYSLHAYRVATDRALREYYTPFHRRAAEREAMSDEDREVIPFAKVITPALLAAPKSEAKCARTVAVLRVVESLRMHAARNGGKLPASLDEVTFVPVPENPMTGEPFLYRLDNGVAVIDLPASDGWPTATRYEVAVVEED
jgi:hypothetical protein